MNAQLKRAAQSTRRRRLFPKRLLAGIVSFSCAVAARADDVGGKYDLGARFQPVPPAVKWAAPDYSLRSGPEIKGEDGKYHPCFYRYPRRLGQLPRGIHSEVAHAVSDTLFGPWKPRAVALPTRGTNFGDSSCTHNPPILRIGKIC